MSKRSIMKLLCLLMALTVVVLHFTPFWYVEGKGVSIGGLIWFPADHPELMNDLDAKIEGGFDLNGLAAVALPILTMVLGLATAILCLLREHKLLRGIAGIAFGAVGAVCYLSSAAMRLGVNWPLHLILCLAVLVLSAAGLMMDRAEKKRA